MQYRVLGPIEVLDGEQRVDLGRRKQRALLALLLLHANQVVSVDRIVDRLWGDKPPAQVLASLQAYVSNLRRLLEPRRAVGGAFRALKPDRAPGPRPQVLVTQPPGYVLHVPPNAIDATRFEALSTEGKELLDAGRPAAAYDVLGLSLDLWRGSAYQDFTFEAFAQAEIARLHELRATAAEARTQAVLDRGRAAEAVVNAESLVADDPLRERRWGLLALALYRDGRQADALRALTRARATLGEELGVELGPELRRLEQEILAHAPALDWNAPVEQPFTAGRRVPLLHGVSMASALASAVAPAAPPEAAGGLVLPPDECPHGYSLAEIAAAVASFQLNGDDPSLYPNTPFQILHVEDVNVEIMGGGAVGTGERSFSVPFGTPFFVPIYVLTSIPPVSPGFPTVAAEAASWMFDPAKAGARDMEIVIDGVRASIGPNYVTGPAPVARDEQHHAIIVSAFVAPMSPGPHTVTIRGGAFGPSVVKPYGLAFTQEEFHYTVHVLPPD